MVQVDGVWRHIHIKFLYDERMQTTLGRQSGQVEYHHTNGELSLLRIERAGMGIRRVRVANLPPEVPDRRLRDVMAAYGDVRHITEDQWVKEYRYPVSNGIRVVEMGLTKPIPSRLTIEGNRVLISYEGQPKTCYWCNAPGHQFQDCPDR